MVDRHVRHVDQLLQFADGLARNDDARHALRTGRSIHLGARQAVPVGRDGAQLQLAAALDGVEVDAVEVVARLFGRDRELRLVDQLLQRRRNPDGRCG